MPHVTNCRARHVHVFFLRFWKAIAFEFLHACPKTTSARGLRRLAGLRVSPFVQPGIASGRGREKAVSPSPPLLKRARAGASFATQIQSF